MPVGDKFEMTIKRPSPYHVTYQSQKREIQFNKLLKFNEVK